MSLTSYIKTNITEMRINMDKYINAPISDEDARSLKSGDYRYSALHATMQILRL